GPGGNCRHIEGVVLVAAVRQDRDAPALSLRPGPVCLRREEELGARRLRAVAQPEHYLVVQRRLLDGWAEQVGGRTSRRSAEFPAAHRAWRYGRARRPSAEVAVGIEVPGLPVTCGEAGRRPRRCRMKRIDLLADLISRPQDEPVVVLERTRLVERH